MILTGRKHFACNTYRRRQVSGFQVIGGDEKERGIMKGVWQEKAVSPITLFSSSVNNRKMKT